MVTLMAIFIDGISSLDCYRFDSAAYDSARVAKRYARVFASSNPSAAQLDALLQTHRYFERPLHVLVSSNGFRRRKKGVSYRVASLPPRDSFLPIDDDIYICSPGFMMARSALALDFPTLIALGYEITGAYRLRPASDQGFTAAPALMTPSRLDAFLSQSEFAGARKARHALRFVSPNSASPRETMLAILLSLPKAKGGYGLPLPQLNYEIEVSKADWRVAFGRRFFCDLFWPDSNLALEYDSDSFHAGAEKIAHDARRRNALSSMGITVITATRAQTATRFGLDQIAAQIARGLGVRLRMERVNRLAQEELLKSLLHRCAMQRDPDKTTGGAKCLRLPRLAA